MYKDVQDDNYKHILVVNATAMMNSSNHPPCHSHMPISHQTFLSFPPCSLFFIPSCCFCASLTRDPFIPPPPLVLPQTSLSLLPSLSVAAEIPFPVGQAKLNWHVYMNNRAVALIYLRVYA